MSSQTSLLALWQGRLGRSSALIGGAASALFAIGWGMLEGRWPSAALLLLLTATALLFLSAGRVGALKLRSRLIVGTLTLQLVLAVLEWGWAFPVVMLSCLLVGLAGVLLGRGAVGWVLAAQLAALAWGARSLPAVPSPLFSDPERLREWVSAGLLFAAIGGALALLLDQASKLAARAYAEADSKRALAEERLIACRESRRQRLEAEHALQAPQKIQAVAQLSGGVAHLLNNTLMIVQGALHGLKGRQSSPELRKRFSESVLEACGRVSTCVGELMVLSRNPAREAQRIALQPAIEGIVGKLAPTLPEDIVLRFEGSVDASVPLSSSRLRQVLANLLLNGADALPNGGQIVVRVCEAKEPTRVRVCVEDDGAGMGSEALLRARDAFFTTKSRGRHAGLGLTVAAGIVEQVGGTLEVRSRLGEGTCVQIELPAGCPVSSTHALAPERSERAASGAAGPLDEASSSSGVESMGKAPGPLPALHFASPSPKQWREQAARRYGKIAAAIFLVALLVSFVTLPGRPLPRYVVPGLGAGLCAIAGWVGRVPLGWRVMLLITGTLIPCLGGVTRQAYLAASPVSGLMAIVAWATLLGPAWGGVATVAFCALSFVCLGVLHVGGPLGPIDPQAFSMNRVDNWIRVSVNLTLCETALGLSVHSILQGAQRGIDAVELAQQSLRSARKEEEQEAERRLQAQRERARAERVSATGQAISTITHDLNNALLSLIGPATALGRARPGPTRIDAIVEDLEQGFHHARVLASQVSAQRPAMALPPRAVCLADATRRVLRSIPPILPKRISLRSNLPECGYVEILESDLYRLLFNLVLNARDAISGLGVISVELDRRGTRPMLSVRDTGCGMDESTQRQLFQPFFTTKKRGTGLGLHSVSAIASRTGGMTSVWSKPGEGATFSVCWPSASAPPRVIPAAVNGSALGRGSRVLVVEDEPRVRAFLVGALREAGHTVHEAGDGDTAERLSATLPGPLTLCIDGVIPGLPSLKVITGFLRHHPGRPIIVCSGHLPENLQQRGLVGELGAKGDVSFLAKPFQASELCELIAEREAAVYAGDSVAT